MIFFRVTRYLRYKLFARHGRGHGIHSPFIFDMITRTFRNKTGSEVVLSVEKIRKKALSSDRIIEVLDLGAGSVKMKGNLRKVSEIARYSAVSEKYGRFLFAMAFRFGGEAIVEYGTSLGISTMYMASGSPTSVVYTMEGCPQTAALACENFTTAGLKNINLLNGSFSELVPDIIRKGIKPGLVFIDGNHRKRPVLEYCGQMAGIANSDTVIIIDDIHCSIEMEEAWNEIKQWKNVSSTVDILRMGIVFFKDGMSHFNYVIRY
jgi:predicted O-methyltransferase YrrM